MKASGLITLITDFGLRDWYAGVMKGVILTINPRARVIDLGHGTAQGDIMGAALALKSSYRFFPRGTVHTVVVDPGVGSDRKIILVEWLGFLFLSPDNGILGLALGEGAMEGARSVERREYWLKEVSRTFHGRDIFAPVAAHLSIGTPPERLGPSFSDCVRLSLPVPRPINENTVEAEVIHVDTFGNLVSCIEEGHPLLAGGRPIAIRIMGREVRNIRDSYSAVSEGELLAICGSSGYLEISIRGGNAARELGARTGTRFSVSTV